MHVWIRGGIVFVCTGLQLDYEIMYLFFMLYTNCYAIVKHKWLEAIWTCATLPQTATAEINKVYMCI